MPEPAAQQVNNQQDPSYSSRVTDEEEKWQEPHPAGQDSGFFEMTITDGWKHEVMVDIQVDTGETIAIYTYKDAIPCLKAKWRKRRKSLFAHLLPEAYDKFASLLTEYEFVIFPSDMEEIEEGVGEGYYSSLMMENPVIKALRDQ